MQIRRLSLLIILGILLVTFFSGCDYDAYQDQILDDEINALLAEAETVQALLPVFTAAQSIYEPDTTTASASMRTLNSGTTVATEWTSKTPSEVFNAGTSTVVSVGSEASPMADLNGNTGDDYYFKLSLYGSSPAAVTVGDENLYKVELYVYPTTSPSVHYVLEEYLVSDHIDWLIVDSSGDASAISFIRYETHYYDGTIDYRTFVWSNSGSADCYTANDLFNETLDDDPASTSYDYPADPATAHQNPSGTGDFSILVSGTIPETNTNFYEYYGEFGGDSSDRRSVSYLYTDLSTASIDGSTKTVRRSYYDVTSGIKTIRSKTVTEMTISSLSITKTSYETVDIDLSAGTYNSEVTLEKVSDGTTSTTTTTTVMEGGTTGTYTGIVTISNGSTETSYITEVSTDGGLTLADEYGNEIIEEGYIPVALEEGEQLITIDIPDGGTIEGILTSGKINGLINSGRAEDVIIGPDYVQIIYTDNNGNKSKKSK